MRRFFAASILLACSFSSFACLNHYHVSASGKTIRGELDGFSFRLYTHDRQTLIKDYNQLTNTLKTGSVAGNYTYYSDYGIILLKSGYVKEGLDVMRYLIKLKPDEYNIVANLATAYELNGKNDSALHWIIRAMQMNDRSHAGSEWIHKRILEAKIKERKSPGWIPANRIFSKQEMQAAGRELHGHFEYQLHERLPFTSTPDPLMSRILEEFGDFMFQDLSVSEAWKIFSAAKVYDPSRAAALDNKINIARTLTNSYRAKGKKRDMLHWPTDESIVTLNASFQEHRFVRVNNIVPRLYH